MKSKKLLSLLFIIQLILCLSFAVSAAEPTDASDLSYTVETPVSTVFTEDTFKVYIKVTENKGFLNSITEFNYDPDTLTYVESSVAESVFPEDKVFVNPQSGGCIKVVIGEYDDLIALVPYTQTGLVVELTFKVTDETFEGSFELSINANSGNVLVVNPTDNTKFASAKDLNWTVNGASLKMTAINSEGHVHTEQIIPGKEATCTEDGLTEGKVCSVCNRVIVEQEVIPAKGHTEVVLPAKEATCTEKGLTEGRKCSVCGEVFEAQKEIPAKGHTEVILPAKEATCTEDGLTEGKKCSVCGTVTIEQKKISAKGHTEEIIPGKEVTCTEDGLTEGKKCSVCGEVLVAQETITAAGHKYDNDCDAECNVCGEKRSVEHSFGEWTVTKEPTETEAGEQKRTCTKCGESETEVIPMLEPSGLSTGAIVAIVIIVVIVVAGGGFSVYWFIIRKKEFCS